MRALLEEQIEFCRANAEETGLARYRFRLAQLLADELDDASAAIPLWEDLRAQNKAPSATDRTITTLERLYGKAGRYGELQ